MEILNLNLDHYSEFELLYEEGIRFYTNYKNIIFKLNIEPNPTGGGATITELSQGENNIYFFSLWYSYFDIVMDELITNSDYSELPEFVRDWNECKGWAWEKYVELITNDELSWFIVKLNEIKSRFEKEYKKDLVGHINCMTDLIFFLHFVKEKDMELRISRH